MVKDLPKLCLPPQRRCHVDFGLCVSLECWVEATGSLLTSIQFSFPLNGSLAFLHAHLSLFESTWLLEFSWFLATWLLPSLQPLSKHLSLFLSTQLP